MNLLITGGAGYIGSHAVRFFANKGGKIYILDNLSTGSELLVDRRTEFVHGDIRDKNLVLDLMRSKKIEAVVHFAALSSVPLSLKDPDLYMSNNLDGTHNLLDCSVRAGIKKFIFSSTAAVYSDPQGKKVNEKSATQPMTPYGVSKLKSEELLAKTDKDFSYSALRYFNVAGVGQDLLLGPIGPHTSSLIRTAAQVATGEREKLLVFGDDYPTKDGTGIRDYIYIEDLIEAHSDVLDLILQSAVREIFNVGYGSGYSVGEVISAMKSASGENFPVEYTARRAGDLAEVIADCSKIQKQTAWKPKHNDLELMCKTAYAWESKSKKRNLAVQ